MLHQIEDETRCLIGKKVKREDTKRQKGKVPTIICGWGEQFLQFIAMF